VSAVPGLPSAEELSALPAAGLAVRLAEAYRLIAELTGQVERLTALNERLSARVDELERRARQDSSTSSRPPSSDGPHKKEKRSTDRSLRERGKRRPGKQPGDPGVTMCLLDDPDESYDCPPAACRRCGAGLAGEPVTASRRHQVTDIEPPPEPKVTQYVAQAKECPCCGTVTEGELPAHVRARASYGPEACAQAACGTSTSPARPNRTTRPSWKSSTPTQTASPQPSTSSRNRPAGDNRPMQFSDADLPHYIAGHLRALPSVEAVTLGGSRATGTHKGR
jgi:hypothetical protein